jgi:hypothetical protein
LTRVQQGREGREKYGRKNREKKGGTSNKVTNRMNASSVIKMSILQEKLKNKPFMLIKNKKSIRNKKKRSLKEQQSAHLKHIKTMKNQKKYKH